MFIALAIILTIFIASFVIFLVLLRKMTFDTFKKLSSAKVSRIAKRKKYLAIDNLNILNYKREKLGVDHVIFGKKYIYIITDFMLKGFVSGEVNDNSWVYYNKITKKNQYLENLSTVSDKNIQEFAAILGINADPIVSICLVPNECDFTVKQLEFNKKMVVHYSSLNRKIKELENQDIGTLNEKQIYEQYSTIKSKNEERS